MSRLNKTIPVNPSFQSSNGVAADGVWEELNRVRGIPSHKKVFITNNEPLAGGFLLISSTTNGTLNDDNAYRLPPATMLPLEIDDASQIRVAGLTGTVAYSWLAY